MRANTHYKRGSFGLLPLGARVVYFCPVKGRKEKLKVDYQSHCPLCGQYQGWGSIDE